MPHTKVPPTRRPLAHLSPRSVTDVTNDKAADLVFFDMGTLRLAYYESDRRGRLVDGACGAAGTPASP